MTAKFKQLIKYWLPPVVISLYQKLRTKKVEGYDGDYSCWQDALLNSTGYDSELILDKVSAALDMVRTGEAVYERDSVLFDQIEIPFPLLTGLLYAAAENNGNLSVLDFGGSLGSTYFQCRNYLSVLSELKWCIVEQEKFVKRGRELFESDQLHFFYTIEECVSSIRPNVLIFSSVLQYIENPFDLIKLATNTSAQFIIIDRTPFSDSENDRLCVQHVPPRIYSASYPSWIFSETQFRKALLRHFELVADFDGADGHGFVSGLPFQFKGLILKRR